MRDQAKTMAASLELTRQTANAATSAAEAAQAANNLSLETFNVRTRPIVSITLDVDSAIVWNDEYAEFSVFATLKNHGISPAQIMHIDLEGVPGSPSHHKNLNNILDFILERREGSTDSLALRWETIYAGEPWSVKYTVRLHVKDILPDKFVDISILGCIWYSSFRGGRIHRAAFTWGLLHNNKAGRSSHFPVGEDKDIQRLEMYRPVFGNFDRDVPDEQVKKQNAMNKDAHSEPSSPTSCPP